jgi:hypothetical protein
MGLLKQDPPSRDGRELIVDEKDFGATRLTESQAHHGHKLITS